jgi:hypothetical protein
VWFEKKNKKIWERGERKKKLRKNEEKLRENEEQKKLREEEKLIQIPIQLYWWFSSEWGKKTERRKAKLCAISLKKKKKLENEKKKNLREKKNCVIEKKIQKTQRMI